MNDLESDSPSGAHEDFGAAMSYGDYLHLGPLLGAQQPLAGHHDEMLFIIIHQATELWMKLIIHEARGALAQVRADDLQPAFKMLARISRIQSQLIQSWDVLSTMTPSEYLSFRDSLGQSSGFQSYQYRTIEFLFGNKSAAALKPHRHDTDVHTQLRGVLESPSLYDETLRLLGRRGLAIPSAVLDRDWSQPYSSSAAVTAAWLTVYRAPARHWELYELAEKLVDLDDWFQQWRFRHLTTVSRIIGGRRGTGGTAGVGYLRRAINLRFFPELWEVRTHL